MGSTGNAAQELHLLALHINPVDQGLEVGRIVLALHLGLESAPVSRILVVVDGVAHLPKIAAQLPFIVPLGLEPGNRNCG